MTWWLWVLVIKLAVVVIGGLVALALGGKPFAIRDTDNEMVGLAAGLIAGDDLYATGDIGGAYTVAFWCYVGRWQYAAGFKWPDGSRNS